MGHTFIYSPGRLTDLQYGSYLLLIIALIICEAYNFISTWIINCRFHIISDPGQLWVILCHCNRKGPQSVISSPDNPHNPLCVRYIIFLTTSITHSMRYIIFLITSITHSLWYIIFLTTSMIHWLWYLIFLTTWITYSVWHIIFLTTSITQSLWYSIFLTTSITSLCDILSSLQPQWSTDCDILSS